MLQNSTDKFLLIIVCAMLSGCFSSGGMRQDVAAKNDEVAVPASVQRDYQSAIARMDANDDVAAASQFEEFLVSYPGYSAAYVNLAIIYEELERPDDADAMLEKAKDLIPGYVKALNQEGLIKRRRGDFQGAQQAWLEAVDSDPEFADGWYNLGVLYDIYLRDYPAAIQAYERYQELYIDEQLQPGGELAADIVAEPDKQVVGWIADVERRIDQSQQAQQAADVPVENSL